MLEGRMVGVGGLAYWRNGAQVGLSHQLYLQDYRMEVNWWWETYFSSCVR